MVDEAEFSRVVMSRPFCIVGQNPSVLDTSLGVLTMTILKGRQDLMADSPSSRLFGTVEGI